MRRLGLVKERGMRGLVGQLNWLKFNEIDF
jgi:hypothetical protein